MAGQPRRMVRLGEFLVGQRPTAFYLPGVQVLERYRYLTDDGMRSDALSVLVPAIDVSTHLGEPKVGYKTYKVKAPDGVDHAFFDSYDGGAVDRWLFLTCGLTEGAPLELGDFDQLIGEFAPRAVRSEVTHDGYDLERGQQRLQVDEADLGVYEGWLSGVVRRLPAVPPGWVGWYYREARTKDRTHTHSPDMPCPICDKTTERTS